MKNRKRALVAFFLAAVLCLGVGYAAVTDILDIQGVANVNATAAEASFDEDIYFTNAVANGVGTPNTASINADNADKGTFTVNSLAGKGDKATFTFTIINKGDLTADVTPAIVSHTNEEFFAVSSDWQGATKTLAGSGATIDYTVTVELLKTPTTTIGSQFGIELTAVAE